MLLGFLSFPVLTRLMPVAQYGELSLLLKLALLWTVLSKCGLQNAALRFFPEQSKYSEEARQACASTLIAESLFIAFAMAALGFALIHMHVFKLDTEVSLLAPLLLALVAVRSIQPTLSGIIRAEHRTWLFNICELSGKALGIGLSLAGLSLIAVDLHYYFAGLLLAEGSVVAAVLLWLRRRRLFSFQNVRPAFARSAWLFSAPLIAYELTSVVLDSGDRLFIGHYLGLRELGFYSAAYAIATYAEESLMQPVNMALFPAYMKIWVEQGAEATSRFLSKSLDFFIMAAGAIGLLVYVCSADLIAILASKKFAAATSLLPILVCGLLVYALHIFFNAPLLIHKHSMALTGVTTSCCVVNLGLNVFLLPRMGIMGAAIATLLSYILLVIVLVILSRRYLKFSLPINTLLCSIALIAVIYAGGRMVVLPSHWLSLALKAPLALTIYAAGMLLLRPALRTVIFSHMSTRTNINESLTMVDG